MLYSSNLLKRKIFYYSVFTLVVAIIVPLFISCTFFIKSTEERTEVLYKLKKNNSSDSNSSPISTQANNNNSDSSNICTSNKKEPFIRESIISGQLLAASDFSDFLQHLAPKYKAEKNFSSKLTFIEKFVLLALLEMNVAPNMASPSANLQVIINYNNQQKYWSFTINPMLELFLSANSILTSISTSHTNTNSTSPTPNPSLNAENSINNSNNSLNKSTDAINNNTNEELTPDSSLTSALPANNKLGDINEKNSSKTKKSTRDNLANQHKEYRSIQTFPYLYGLEKLLESYPSSHSLLSLAEIMDKYYTTPIKVEEKLAKFLKFNENNMRGDTTFKKYYFRDDEILKKMEILPKVPFQKIVNLYLQYHRHHLKEFIYKVDNQLIPYQLVPSKNLSIKCNIDLKYYEKSIYRISSHKTEHNIFGIQDDKKNSALASSAQNISNSPLFNSILFSSNNHNVMPPAICLINIPNKMQLSILSGNERDPGQLLYHLLKDHWENISTREDVEAIWKHARYLILNRPTRLIVESDRLSKKQSNRILSLDYPIYHASKLGDLIGHLTIHNKDREGKVTTNFIADDRQDHYITCW